jgi:hypothetical protein
MSTKWFAMLAATAVGAIAAVGFTPTADAARTGVHNDAERLAREFLASLPAPLHTQAQYPFDSDERTKWYFVPRDRIGVSMLQLDDAQSEKLGPLIASALSPEGLLTARGVMKHENILRRVETELGVDASRRDPGRYYATVFGKPQDRAPWSWRFEGHHLSINVTELPGHTPIVAPLFVGANPARVLSGPNAGFRLLAAEEDLGREMVKSLTPEQLKAATIRDTAFAEIVTGNDPKVQPLEQAGLAVAQMDARERDALQRLLAVYLDRLTGAAAADARERLESAGFDKVRFAWAGGTEPGQPHYYRIHGPTLLIEYDDTQNDANHIHTVYRDLEHDFGGDVLRAHYRRDHEPRIFLSSR